MSVWRPTRGSGCLDGTPVVHKFKYSTDNHESPLSEVKAAASVTTHIYSIEKQHLNVSLNLRKVLKQSNRRAHNKQTRFIGHSSFTINPLVYEMSIKISLKNPQSDILQLFVLSQGYSVTKEMNSYRGSAHIFTLQKLGPGPNGFLLKRWLKH